MPPGKKHPKYMTPAPGAYDVISAKRASTWVSRNSAFGGALNKVDREKTGTLNESFKRRTDPSPSAYGMAPALVAITIKRRSGTTKFGTGERPGLTMPNDTPGPGTYGMTGIDNTISRRGKKVCRLAAAMPCGCRGLGVVDVACRWALASSTHSPALTPRPTPDPGAQLLVRRLRRHPGELQDVRDRVLAQVGGPGAVHAGAVHRQADLFHAPVVAVVGHGQRLAQRRRAGVL